MREEMAKIYHFKRQKKRLQKKERRPGMSAGERVSALFSALNRIIRRFLAAGFHPPPGKKNSQPSGAVSK
jgi:hypothetical protein